MKIHSKELETVVLLPPIKRYQYFLKKVADGEKMYTLESVDGNLAISEIEGKTMMPFWPKVEFVDSCRVNEWASFVTKEITLDIFQDEIIELMIDNDYLANIFPVKDFTGFVVTLNEFSRDLGEELSKYE